MSRGGERNSNWKGGRHIGDDGYAMVMMHGHPRANHMGYVREHILVAERALGRSLPADAVVHHVDEHKTGNENANLVVCQDQAYHLLLHQRMRAIAACGHAGWRRCVRCKRYDDPANLAKHTATSLVHPSCANAHTQRQQEAKRVLGAHFGAPL